MENNNQIIYFLHINITSTVIYNLQKLFHLHDLVFFFI